MIAYLIAAVLTLQNDAQSHQIPKAYQGVWSYSPSCDPKKGKLRISATTLQWSEFRGKIFQLMEWEREKIVIFVQYSAEGNNWSNTDTLRLWNSGAELTVDPQRTARRYYRCPMTAAPPPKQSTSGNNQ